MTPLQIGGYYRLALKERNNKLAELMAIFATASRAEGKDIKAQIKELTDDAGGV